MRSLRQGRSCLPPASGMPVGEGRQGAPNKARWYGPASCRCPVGPGPPAQSTRRPPQGQSLDTRRRPGAAPGRLKGTLRGAAGRAQALVNGYRMTHRRDRTSPQGLQFAEVVSKRRRGTGTDIPSAAGPRCVRSMSPPQCVASAPHSPARRPELPQRRKRRRTCGAAGVPVHFHRHVCHQASMTECRSFFFLFFWRPSSPGAHAPIQPTLRRKASACVHTGAQKGIKKHKQESSQEPARADARAPCRGRGPACIHHKK